MPLRPCLEPDCAALVRSGRCPEHDTDTRAVYRDARWRGCRARAIARAGGLCQALIGGVRCTVTHKLEGHHNYPGGLSQMLKDGVSPFDTRFVVVLCGRCHRRLEARLRAAAGTE